MEPLERHGTSKCSSCGGALTTEYAREKALKQARRGESETAVPEVQALESSERESIKMG
jgi:hypothetical protein